MEYFGKDLFGIDESRNHERSYSGTLLFKGHLHSGDTKLNLAPEKHVIFVFVTSPEGTPLLREKGHFSFVPKASFNFLSADTLVLQQCLTSKKVDKFHCSLVKMATAFKT